MDAFVREIMLIGEPAFDKLRRATVAVFGLGGVGSFAAEALVRAGVGGLVLVDPDRVAKSNINRQLYALTDTVGRLKTEVAAERARAVNPHIRLEAHPCFFEQATADIADFSSFHYVVDAIDTVTSKLLIARLAKEAGVPAICCLGAGNRLDPSRLRVADIFETSVCPLARVMRKELRALGFSSYRVVFSDEPPITPLFQPEDKGARRQIPGSVSFVPSVAGLLMAAEAVRALAGV